MTMPFAAFAATLALALAAPASAAAVTIVNAGFDARSFGDGGYSFGSIDGSGGYGGGWYGTSDLNNGVWNPTTNEFPSVPSESNVAFAGSGVDAQGPYGGALYQTLGQSAKAGFRYTLAVEIGRRADGYDLADFAVELFSGSQVLASGTFGRNDVAAGSFRTLTVSHLATANGASPLGIRLRSTYDPAQGTTYRQTLFDNVSLDTSRAAVPEPATWATMMLGFGLVGAAARRRRPSLRSC